MESIKIVIFIYFACLQPVAAIKFEISHEYKECNWYLVEIRLKFDDLRELLLTRNQAEQP